MAKRVVTPDFELINGGMIVVVDVVTTRYDFGDVDGED